MIHHVLAVYDEKVEAFASPFFNATELVGQRAFIAACQDTTSLLARFPEDYRLYSLGTFDDVSGHFTSYDRPKLLMGAHQVERDQLLPLKDAAVAQVLS